MIQKLISLYNIFSHTTVVIGGQKINSTPQAVIYLDGVCNCIIIIGCPGTKGYSFSVQVLKGKLSLEVSCNHKIVPFQTPSPSMIWIKIDDK